MSVAASLAHLVCMAFGPAGYLFMGAPSRFAYAAGRGEITPIAITLALASILMGWAIYAFSAAKLIRRLPLMRLALVLISAVLLVRGFGYFAAPVWKGWRPDLSPTFMFWSSAITVVMGLCFAIGTWKAWPQLSATQSKTTGSAL